MAISICSKKKLGLGVHLVLVSEHEGEGHGVDGVGVLARVVLKAGREEALGEVKAGNPVAGWDAPVHPAHEELEAGDEVFEPRAQGLERRISDGGPGCGHALVEAGVAHGLELSRQHH